MLSREEYVEQAHLFRVFGERLQENLPTQELLEAIGEELLATTRLPMAIGYLLTELKHSGEIGAAMLRLPHYFTSFQTYVIQEAENERGRFDMRIALAILRRESEYRVEGASPQGMFFYQFETLCRNRLSYDRGLGAMAGDPIFDEEWRTWILTVRRQIGLIDLADLIFVRSRYHGTRLQADDAVPARTLLFGEKEGKIAWANRGKDPLYLFAALQRHLGYPEVPRPQPTDDSPTLLPQLARRLERLETRLKMLEDEQRSGSIDLSKFYRPEE